MFATASPVSQPGEIILISLRKLSRAVSVYLSTKASLSLEVETMKDSQAEPDHGIKCKWMLSARNYLSNTTFHGIPWVLEDISKGAKVKAKTSCY